MNRPEFILFETPGKGNTLETLSNAKRNAEILQIHSIVLASTTGYTVQEALQVFDPSVFNIVCVSHNFGFKEGVTQTFPEDLRNKLKGQGVKVVTGTLAFSGVSSALMRKYQFFDFSAMFAKVIRGMLCDGVKVAVECAMMACDAGAIEIGEDILAIGGTGRGADTCCWIRAQSSRWMDELRIKAVLAKPV